jgi:hypothetical protein
MFQRIVVLITLGWVFFSSSEPPPDSTIGFPEVPEQVVDHNGGNSSEAQDLLEVIVIIILLSSINHIMNVLCLLQQISSSYISGY